MQLSNLTPFQSKTNLCHRKSFPTFACVIYLPFKNIKEKRMKKVIGIISLLLSVTLATANPIDFDKAFKESAKIEKQIKRTSFPKRTYLKSEAKRA